MGFKRETTELLNFALDKRQTPFETLSITAAKTEIEKIKGWIDQAKAEIEELKSQLNETEGNIAETPITQNEYSKASFGGFGFGMCLIGMCIGGFAVWKIISHKRKSDNVRRTSEDKNRIEQAT